MIDINELRQSLGAVQPEEVAVLLDRLESAESDALEQARLNGMGSEREAALMAKLEAAEKSDAESIAMYRKARDERDELQAKVEEMERQFPICRVKDIKRAHYITKVVGLDPDDWLYLAPGAQPAPSHALDDNATIAGLESAVTHLSVLLDSFRALLVEVNDVCGRDGHGGQLEDGESEIIDKVRAAISMTEAPPCAKGEEK